MWRWFRFKNIKDGNESTRAGYTAEVLDANWIAPPPHFPVITAALVPARGEAPDAVTFLARVYANQQC